MLELTIDSHIRIPLDQAPKRLIEAIKLNLTISNLERKAAEKHGADVSGMEREIKLFDENEDYLLVPRGFGISLLSILERNQVAFDWLDLRTFNETESVGNEIPIRHYQAKVIDAIEEAEQGIVKAPTGAGKTVAALDAVNKFIGKTLVVVNTKEIADQWINRAKQWLGEDYPLGFIGDGEFEVSSHLTVATQQTIWSRRTELWEQGFFSEFNGVIVDECHHSNARTYRELLTYFSSRFRFGMSATPEKTGDFRISKAVLGEIIVEVTEEDVKENIINPEIVVIPTKFDEQYRAAFTDRNGRRVPNNYQKILSKLSKDAERNDLIATEIVTNHFENANLVLSKRTGHLAELWDALVQAGYPEDQIFTIVGADSRHSRQVSVERTEEANCVILSTLADEALDAPRLDRVHLAFPTKNIDLVRQQIGRIRRKHPAKSDAIVLDYHDWKVGPLNKQYMGRRHDLYNKMGWQVSKRKREL